MKILHLQIKGIPTDTCSAQSENLCNLKIVFHILRILRLCSNLKIVQL